MINTFLKINLLAIYVTIHASLFFCTQKTCFINFSSIFSVLPHFYQKMFEMAKKLIEAESLNNHLTDFVNATSIDIQFIQIIAQYLLVIDIFIFVYLFIKICFCTASKLWNFICRFMGILLR